MDLSPWSSLSPELRRISFKSSSICAFLLIKRLTGDSLRKKMALDMSSLLNILRSPASSATIQVLRQQFACILLTHMILNLRSSFGTWSPSFFHGFPEGEWITQIVVQVKISGRSMYIASFQEWACLKVSGPYDLVRLSTTANWSPFTEEKLWEKIHILIDPCGAVMKVSTTFCNAHILLFMLLEEWVCPKNLG